MAIEKLAANKAPGPDEISNIVLKKSVDKIRHHILALAQASLNAGHFPTFNVISIFITLF